MCFFFYSISKCEQSVKSIFYTNNISESLFKVFEINPKNITDFYINKFHSKNAEMFYGTSANVGIAIDYNQLMRKSNYRFVKIKGKRDEHGVVF